MDATPKFEITTSRQFTSWLAEQKTSLAFTTYQAGRLFFIGTNAQGRLAVFNRTFERCMGLACKDDELYLAGLYQVFKFKDAAQGVPTEDGYDAVFVPQMSSYTGDLDVHDIAIGEAETAYFVNTLFSCLATLETDYSFRPIWKPPFVDRLAAEDRCHLNGLAVQDGKPAYATAVAETNVADGWRDHRADGGIVIDVTKDRTIARGLSMPHSPRVYRDALWVHNSGTGEFGRVDLDAGTFEPLAFCPGYLRGMDFIDKFAIVGLSKPRDNRTFAGLALDGELAKQNVEARCGLYVIDLDTGDVVHWLRIEGLISELYDVVVLPGKRNVSAIGFVGDAIRRVISIAS